MSDLPIIPARQVKDSAAALLDHRPIEQMSKAEIVRRITTLGYAQDVLIAEYQRRGFLQYDQQRRPIIPDARPAELFFIDHGYGLALGDNQ